MKISEVMKRTVMAGALVAIVLATAICVEGYYIYRQARDIERLESQLKEQELLPPATLSGSPSGDELVGRILGMEVAGVDMVVHDEPDRYVVETRMPDFNGSDIRVAVDGRKLRVAAEERRQMAKLSDSAGEAPNEEFIAKIEREVTLPGPVDSAGLTHEYANGVLTITIPKSHV